MTNDELTMSVIRNQESEADDGKEDDLTVVIRRSPSTNDSLKNDLLRSVWPEWKNIRKLGEGAFGVVYEAVREDHSITSRAAIKIISIPSKAVEIESLRSEGFTEDQTRSYLKEIVDDFINEIQLLESFKGLQNIVSIEDYAVVQKEESIGWDILIRMELLMPLTAHIKDRMLAEEDVIKIGTDVCNALEVCAEHHVIHRDVKPENIFINQFGSYKLGDFGIARKLENIAGGLSQKGTYNYMAPEIEKGEEYDERADIYSLGLVLYRLMNENRLPFLATEEQWKNPHERTAAVNRRLRGEPLPAPCNASPEMSDVILCACAYSPDRRFMSASAMKKALLSIKTGQSADHDKNGEDISGRSKKSRIPIIAAAAFLFIAGIFIMAGLFNKDNRTSGDSIAQETETETERADDVYSDYDEDQIAEAVKKADAQGESGDYEGALRIIKTSLATYPKSKVLQDKEDEYEEKLAARETVIESETITADIDGVNQQIVSVAGRVEPINKVWSLSLDEPKSVYARNSSGNPQLFQNVTVICLATSSSGKSFTFSDYSGWLVSADGSLAISEGKLCLIVSEIVSLAAPEADIEKEEEKKEAIQSASNKNYYYILPDSSSKYLKASDLAGLSEHELMLARNEIYARHGYIFNDKEIRSYFESMPWYHPAISSKDFTSDMLNSFEKKNIDLILDAE